MYKQILDYVESKIDDFNRPKILPAFFNQSFCYFDKLGTIVVPGKSSFFKVVYDFNGWRRFILNYLKDEFDLHLQCRDYFVFAFLHEVGHHVNLNNLDDSSHIRKHTRLEYRKLPNEYAADKFAVDFIKAFPDVLNMSNDLITDDYLVTLEDYYNKVINS